MNGVLDAVILPASIEQYDVDVATTYGPTTLRLDRISCGAWPAIIVGVSGIAASLAKFLADARMADAYRAIGLDFIS